MKYLISTSLFASISSIAYLHIQSRILLPLMAGGISLYWLFHRFLTMRQEINFLREETQYFVESFRSIRNPITLVHTPLKALCNDSCPDNIKKELLLAIRNMDCLEGHLARLMNLKQLSIHSTNVSIAEYELGNFVRNRINSLNEYAASRLLKVNIEATFSYGSAWFDQSKVSLLIENFLKNAIDDAESGKDIALFLSLSQEHWEIKLTDSVNNNLMKSTLCKRLIKLCKGEILINNLKRTVSIQFPVKFSGKEQSKRTMTHIADNHKEHKIDTLFHKTTQKRNSAKPVVIIADSNDDFRLYLESRLKEEFTVKSFGNGMEALTCIKESYPDIVICDTMLQGMCGIELSSRLKTSRDMSIIPVILYGSHIDIDQHGKREASLADTFLHLPFNIEELKIEMCVLIKNSRFLRRSFLQKVFGEQFLEAKGDKPSNEMDYSFIDQVKEYVLKNIDNENLKIDDIASELCMSRTAFFNKWKLLTGEAPKFFIYRIRMEKARELLESGKCSVNVVPEKIGLKNLKNFRHKYKEHFGITPSESIMKKQ